MYDLPAAMMCVQETERANFEYRRLNLRTGRADTLFKAEKTNSRVFPTLSQAYVLRIREINAESHTYLQTHPYLVDNGTQSVSDATE
jgi:hypothetical protein